MSALVVWPTLILGLGFALAYFLFPRLKSQIESPKYMFQEQLKRYDTQQAKRTMSKENANEQQ